MWSTYERDAAAFAPDGDSALEILDMGASGDLAFWVGYQRVTARLGGSPEPNPMSLRVSEVFRREGDEWKLVHRHADSLASPRDDAS